MSATQSEKILEDKLVDQLQSLGYESVAIRNEDDLIENLKRQLEIHNRINLSDPEFRQILNTISGGNIFEKAKTLRGKVDYRKDSGETGYIELIDQISWCKNEYQVTRQVTMEGRYTNRYDVTLLINGLPLVHIELKRRGLELKEAFNQINRYHRHSFLAGKGLFGYIQVFVISNGVNTKYFANNPVKNRDFKQTFFWADGENQKVVQLSEFAEAFLEKCQLSKLITKYVVLNESSEMLMVLRSYQYHAVEAIVERVRNTEKFGYIWHTTGSGKTLTSFKAAQILTSMPKVHKVVFVVDRKDLDYQTIREFNSFREGSVDATNNTRSLVRQFGDDTKLIVTTLQKLDIAISKDRYSQTMQAQSDRQMVFIFDECHRSQFGDTHRRIRQYFSKVQMFGFTGTPIFAQNSSASAHGKRTTKDLFGECLHKYVITDAIRDENVLRFSVEYIRTVRQKDEIVDLEVEAIDKPEVMAAEPRLDLIADHIIANHGRKTHSRDFTALFCISNIKTLIRYCDLFRKKKDSGSHNLKIAAIFSYQANEDDSDAAGFIESDVLESNGGAVNQHSRDHLERFIRDYNGIFGTNFSTDSFYGYYKDVGRKVRERKIDILLVVNMFLTGFDSPALNTLYVDKNLKYHGLIQAYSRTNRILGSRKSQGNIVVYRHLKPATDEAIELFANKDAIEEVVLEPYKFYVEKFAQAVDELLKIAPTVESVDELLTEEDEMRFIQAFRELIRIMNVINCFVEFRFDDLAMNEQLFEDYRSRYLDLYDKARSNWQKEAVSILDDIDFELELIHRDRINVSYIIALLQKLKSAKAEDQEKQRKEIDRLLETEIELRSKKELIERFISQYFPSVPDAGSMRSAFEEYWNQESERAILAISEEENLDSQGLRDVIDNFIYTQKPPLRNEVIGIRQTPTKLTERRTIAERIIERIREFVETFIESVD